MQSRLRIFVFIVLAMINIVFFQNCAPGFVSFEAARTGSSLGGAPIIPGIPTDTISYVIPAKPFEKLSLGRWFVSVTPADAKNFFSFTPQYPLYSYGATKERWIYLPMGQKINNQNPDAWSFPAGTVLWKLFSVDNRKVETRVFEKISNAIGYGAWRASVYLWRVDQTDADLLTTGDFYALPEDQKNLYEAGRVADRYRISHANQCLRCHSGASDVAQGFTYLQLSNSNLSKNVFTISSAGLFQKPVLAFDQIPGSDAQKNAIGYIQSNCATCHFASGPAPHDFKHVSTVTDENKEPILLSAIASPGLIQRGSADSSRLFQRFSGGTMPPFTIAIDPSGREQIQAWINSLAP